MIRDGVSSSNAADAFGYMAIGYEEPKPTVIRRPSLPPGASVWVV
jgi:hypothetical protein